MIAVGQDRRGFFKKFCVALTPMIVLAAGQLRAGQSQGSSPVSADQRRPGENNENAAIAEAASRKAALEENEKDIKKKVERLFELATELKDEVDKTDSVKVLSVAMLKKADEIEKLAKDIKTRAKG